MAELYVVRQELEGLAARLAAKHAASEEVAVLREMVEADGRFWGIQRPWPAPIGGFITRSIWHRIIATSFSSSTLSIALWR